MNKLVYFIQEGDAGPVKIGVSSNPRSRLSMLRSSNPHPLRILGVVQGNELVEQSLHSRFSHLLIHGEWYRPCSDLLSYIQQHATPYPSATTRRSKRLWRLGQRRTVVLKWSD